MTLRTVAHSMAKPHREITVGRTLNAPREAVWAVLADFPNISRWNSGVTKSHATSDAANGVGATRHCDLAPLGALEETIVEWSPTEKMVVRIDSAAKLPIKTGLATFELGDEVEAGTTPTEIHYAYDPKYGVVGKAMAPTVDRQLRKGFEGFLDDLETAARDWSTTDA